MSKTCTIESLQRLASQLTEITSQERVLNQYFDLFKQNQFDENTAVDNLEHCAKILSHTFVVQLSTAEFDTRAALLDYLKLFEAGLSWLYLDCQRLLLFILPDESENTDVGLFLSELAEETQRLEHEVSRTAKLLPNDKNLDWSHDLQDIVFGAQSALEKVTRIMHDTTSSAVSQLTTNGEVFSTGECVLFRCARLLGR